VIVLNLCCDREHLFEGWFASAEAFESQRAQGLVSCPVCASLAITRRPTAPYVISGASAADRPAAPMPSGAGGAATPDPDALAVAMSVLRRMGRASEDVGERFAEEARRIHYGESESRNIRGKASGDDVESLLDEGILVLPLPQDEGDLH